MGFHGPDLADLFLPAPTERAGEMLAFRGGQELKDQVVLYTPVDSGRLRSSWETTRVRKVAMVAWPAYVVTVFTRVDYSSDVEFGTGLFGPAGMKYPIESKTPGGVLSWITKKGFVDKRTGKFVAPGTRVYARRVMHPGSEGAHMMQRAVAMLDARWERTVAPPVLDVWVAESEQLFIRAQARAY